MKDAELASELRLRASAAESMVEKMRSWGDVDEEMIAGIEEGVELVRRAATRIECGPLDRPDPGVIITMTEERIWGIAFAAAGTASTPFMRDHPHYVMPSDEIKEGVTTVLAEMGFTDPPVGYGPPPPPHLAPVPDQTDAAIEAREHTRRRMEGKP